MEKQATNLDTPTTKCRPCQDKGYTSDYGNTEIKGIGVLPKTFCKRCDLGKSMYEEWLALPETKSQIVKAFAKDLLGAQTTSQIPPKFRDFTLPALSKNPGLLAIIEKYIENFPSDGSKGLYLWGNIGAWKTTTAAIVANEIIGRYWTDCLMINWATWLSMVKDSFDNKMNTTGKNLLARLRSSRLLIIDDIHQEKGSDWVREQLFITVNYRYEQGLPTIITSQWPIEDVAERYAPQIASRLIETCEIIEFTGEDRRQQEKSIF